MKIKISGIEYLRYEDGPGIRTTIFFQGCHRKCFNCHNKDTWDLKKGIELEVEEIYKEIKKDKNPYKRVTVSGGEPLLQKEGLYLLIKFLKEKGYDIGLYTSYQLDEIPREILKYLNFVKIGEYIEKLKIENTYYGSSNQKLLFLKEGRVII